MAETVQSALDQADIRIFKSRTAANARCFLRDLERACPMRIRQIRADLPK